MEHKYIVKCGSLTKTAYNSELLDALIEELLTWGAKLADITITLEKSPGQRD